MKSARTALTGACAATTHAEPCSGTGTGSSRFGSSGSDPHSENRTDARFGVTGTDLGIMWDEWRHNILMRSDDDLYFVASRRSDYNVTLLRTTLS